MQRSDYLHLRHQFEPTSITLVIVAESPPASGKYFYNPEGSAKEPLFAALMKQLGCAPDSKEDGLREFQRRGWVLVDATYEPVNEIKGQKRDGVILRDYRSLLYCCCRGRLVATGWARSRYARPTRGGRHLAG